MQYISDDDINHYINYTCGDGLRKAILAKKFLIRLQCVSAYCFFFLVAITAMVNQVYQVTGVCVEDHPNISTETCVDDPEFQGIYQ